MAITPFGPEQCGPPLDVATPEGRPVSWFNATWLERHALPSSRHGHAGGASLAAVPRVLAQGRIGVDLLLRNRPPLLVLLVAGEPEPLGVGVVQVELRCPVARLL